MASGTIVRISSSPAARAAADTGGTAAGAELVAVGLTAILDGVGLGFTTGLLVVGALELAALEDGELATDDGADDETRSATGAWVQPATVANSNTGNHFRYEPISTSSPTA